MPLDDPWFRAAEWPRRRAPDEAASQPAPENDPAFLRPPAGADEGSLPMALPAEDDGVLMVVPADEEDIPLAVPAPRPPHPGYWWSVLWCGAFFLLVNVTAGLVAAGIVIVQMVGQAGPGGMHEGAQKRAEITQLVMTALGPGSLVAEAVCVVFALGLARLFAGPDWKRRLGWCRPSLAQVVLAFLLLPGIMVLSNGAYFLAQQFLPGLGHQQNMVEMLAGWPLWLGLLAVGIGAPVAEEVMLRGFIGRGLVARYGVVGGILLTSMLFGALHVDPPHVVATFFMGIVLHAAYLMTRSLWVPILLHALNNSLAVLQSKFPELDLNPGAPAGPAEKVAFAAAVVLFVAACWALYGARARLWDRGGEGTWPWRPDFPGVEMPPARSSTAVARPWPGWVPSGAVAASMLLFATAVYRVVQSAMVQ